MENGTKHVSSRKEILETMDMNTKTLVCFIFLFFILSAVIPGSMAIKGLIGFILIYWTGYSYYRERKLLSGTSD